MSISAVEDHIIAKAEATLGSALKTVEALPSALNMGLLKQILATAPAVYVAFLGGRGGRQGTINGRFTVYAITRHVGNESARRRGDGTTIGAYQIIEALIPKIEGSTIQGVGTLELTGVNNLFSVQLEEKLRAAMYAITFELPNMPFPDNFDPSTLADFVTFHAEHSLVEGEDEPAAIDNVTLEQ